MQTAIGGYASQTAAEHAVRGLEATQQLSIQDMVIADRRHNFWRKLHPPEGKNFPDWVQFVVLMRGQPDEIARARGLLRDAGL
jgi:hypothetical protein